MAVLEAFVYDPLIAWRLTTANQPGGRVNEPGDVDEAAYAKQRKSKANETEILNGMFEIVFEWFGSMLTVQKPTEQKLRTTRLFKSLTE